jgi:hypothetical protein
MCGLPGVSFSRVESSQGAMAAKKKPSKQAARRPSSAKSPAKKSPSVQSKPKKTLKKPAVKPAPAKKAAKARPATKPAAKRPTSPARGAKRAKAPPSRAPQGKTPAAKRPTKPPAKAVDTKALKQREALAKEKARQAAQKEKERLLASKEKERQAALKEKEKKAAQKEKEREAAQKEKERLLASKEKERQAALKEKEHQAALKEKEKKRLADLREKERVRVEKEREKERLLKEKAKEKERLEKEKEKERERIAAEKEKERLEKEKEKERERIRKEKEKLEAARRREEERLRKEKEREAYRKAREAERAKVRSEKEAQKRALEGRVAKQARAALKAQSSARGNSSRVYRPDAIPSQSRTTREGQMARLGRVPPPHLRVRPSLPPLAIKPPPPSEIDARWAKIQQRLSAMPERFQREYAESFDMSWIHHDSALEGVVYTFPELKTAIDANITIVPDSGLQPVCEEIRRHKAALDVVRELGRSDTPITADVMKRLYLILHPEEGDIKSVKYRKEIPQHRLYFHEYAPPDKIAVRIRQALEWFHGPEAEKLRDPVRVSARLHYDLLRTFPFPEDSGKVARMIMNIVLLRAKFPPAILHSTERQRYYDALRGALPTIVQMVNDSIKNTLVNIEKMLDDEEEKAIASSKLDADD